MKYISIDTETTGFNPDTSQLLEVGIVIFNSSESFTPSSDNSLRIVLVQDELKGNSFAINMNNSLIQEMIKIGPKFDEPNVDFIIEEVTDTLTTLYIDLRSKHALTSNLYIYDCEKALSNLSYKITAFLSAAKVEGKFNIAGKNFSGFDKLFLEQFDCFKTSILNRARHRVLDIGSMFVTKEDEYLPDLKECLMRCGHEIEVPHTAVEDAQLIVKAALYKFNDN
jgi:hypothetical protein